MKCKDNTLPPPLADANFLLATGSQLYLGGPVTPQDDSPSYHLQRIPSSAVQWRPGSGLWVKLGSLRANNSTSSFPSNPHGPQPQTSPNLNPETGATATRVSNRSGGRGGRVLDRDRPKRPVPCAGACFPWTWLPPLLQQWQEVCVRVLQHPMVNRPVAATLVALAVAAVDPVRNLFVVELQPLNWLWRSLAWMGAACAPLATMQMGEWQ